MENTERKDKVATLGQELAVQTDGEDVSAALQSEITAKWEDPAVLYEDKTYAYGNARLYYLNNGTAKSVIRALPADGAEICEAESQTDYGVMPMAVDAQIASGITWQVQKRDVIQTGAVTYVYGDWYNVRETNIRIFKDLQAVYRTLLTVKKEAIHLLKNRIASAKLVLTPLQVCNGYFMVDGKMICYAGKAKLETDLTARIKSDTEDITVTLEPTPDIYDDFIGETFYGQTNSPVLEVEYLRNENVKPCLHTFALAENVEGILDVPTGDLTTVIASVSGEGLTLPYGVSHIYKPSTENFGVGTNFRLNLHERLVKNGDSALDADYVYTDSYGNKHGFKEHFYYLDDNNQKTTVSRADVTVEPDGTLWCTDASNIRREVTKEALSDTGLKAVTELSGVGNVDVFEQRQEEIKQLEEQVESYENALKEFVLVDAKSGEIIDKAKSNLIFSDTFNTFVHKISDKSLLLTENEATNFKSLLLQKQSLDLQDKTATLQSETLSHQISSMYTSEDALEIQIDELKYMNKSAEGDMRSINNRSITNLGLQRSDIETQIKDLSKQKVYAGKQSHIIAGQDVLAASQIDMLKSKQEQYTHLIKQYYKEYVIKKAELALRTKYTPVNYLTDGSIVKGYNADGDMVAIFDRYENALMIERDKSDRISRVVDNKENAIVFSYNRRGFLTSVTDARGRTTKYSYMSNMLLNVEFADGKKHTMHYADKRIYAIETSSGAVELTYSGTQLTKIKYITCIDSICHGAVKVIGGKPLFEITVGYSEGQTAITERTEEIFAWIYRFDTNGNPIEYYEQKNEHVIKAEQYSYEKYNHDNTTYAKKDTLYKTHFAEFTFTPEEYRNVTLNDFNNPVTEERGGIIIGYDTSVEPPVPTTQQSVTTYTYDDEQRVTQERTQITTQKGDNRKIVYAEKKYNYNTQGNVVRIESYIEGEEYTTGKTVEETVYDEKGRVLRSCIYNSLDASSKFYTENAYDENGKVIAEKDETGEHKTEFEYADGTDTVRTKTLPNGSTFGYGHDENGEVTAVTQSTAAGEENSTQIARTCGEITELRSGNNVVRYAYDGQRRKTAVDLNGQKNYITCQYGVTNYVRAEQVDLCNGDTIESRQDFYRNILQTKYNGQLLTSATYDGQGKIQQLTDGITGVATQTEYDNLDRVVKITGDVTETTEYNSDGNVATKTVTADGKETCYTYAYKENAAKDLESITVDGITVSPQTDCLGRNTGKEICLDGRRIAEEQRTYRKAGDHATNMPSAIRFGHCVPDPATEGNTADAEDVIASDSEAISSMHDTTGAENVIASDSEAISSAHETTTTENVIASDSEAISSMRQSRFVRLDNLKYKYDSCGNITEVRENGALAAKYTYDAIGRLVREDNKQLGKTTLFAYDNNGNILNKREFAFTLKATELLEEMPETQNVQYAYDGDRLLSFGSEQCVYDILGNPTVYRGKVATWERGRNLASYNGVTFAYNGQGRRIRKTIGDTTITFTYDGNGNLLKQSNGLEFLYDHEGVLGVRYDGATFFYRRNAQGDIIALLDSNGGVVVKYVYDAWGNHEVKVLDSAYTALSQLNPYRYRGYYYDTETRLYYLQTRYYDPEAGRFTTIDDIQYLDPEHVNGLNLYAYCGNNPVMNVDPEGTSLRSLWRKVTNWIKDNGAIIVGVISAVVIATVAIVATVATGGLATLLIGVAAGAIFGATFGAITAHTNGENILYGMLSGLLVGALSGISALATAIGAFTASLIGDKVNDRELSYGNAIISAMTAGVFAKFSLSAGKIVSTDMKELAGLIVGNSIMSLMAATYNFVADWIIKAIQFAKRRING